LVSQGLSTGHLDAEDCALYATNRLSQAEIDQLAAKGIVVTPELWIPPIAGKHPLGYHLASVPYGSLDFVRDDARFVRLESTEFQNQPMNDLAGIMINSDDVHNGTGVPSCTGAGVKIAVADSGVDLTHADIPTPVEAYDMTTGTSPATWSTVVRNTVSAHGTHVTGTVLGRGTLSGGKYQGSAPGASLYFYKIGDSTTGSASDTDMIEAINRAVTVGANILTISYGGFSTYMDGSESVEQAIDAAVATGVVVFVAAGNEGSSSRHSSVSVAPGTTSADFSYLIDNSASGSSYTTSEYIEVVWRDGNAGDFNLSLACSTLGTGESLSLSWSGSSSRGTESRQYKLTPKIAASSSKTYSFTLQNTAGTGSTPLVHCYQLMGKGTFTSPDPAYTVGHPAIADGAIAVGAWTQRKSWTDYQNNGWQYSSLTVGTLAPFSSLGPRVDGLRKPDIVAPGAATISARDSVSGLAATAALIIDNDGANLNGSGPANYYVMAGTSMACPMAAGAAALLLQNNPAWTPAQVKTALTATASMAATPNNSVGYGLINALAAVVYDTVPPAVTINQAAGQADPTNTAPVNFTVVFSESAGDFATGDVTVTGTAPGTKTATVTGSGTTYNVAVGGMTGSGTVIAALAAGVAHDAAGNGNTASASTDNTVTYDVTAPAFSSIAASPSLAKQGTAVTITFTASETLSANPAVTVNTHVAGYVGKSGNNYTYSYTIQASDADGDATIAISGSDSAGNSGSANNTTALDVDKTAPVISSITSSTANGTYGQGSVINVTLNFSEPVTLAGGDLIITLETGDTDREVRIAAISGAATAGGAYTVQAGDASADLAVKGIALDGAATLRDAAGNGAGLGLPAGQNLNDNKDIVILTARTLEVVSAYGNAFPAVGTYTYSAGTSLACLITNSPVTIQDARSMVTVVCTGWTGTGSAPLTGNTTNTESFALTADSSITWHWLITDMVVSNQVVNTATNLQARDTITAQNGYQLQGAADVNLQVGSTGTVVLGDGFDALSGSTLKVGTDFTP